MFKNSFDTESLGFVFETCRLILLQPSFCLSLVKALYMLIEHFHGLLLVLDTRSSKSDHCEIYFVNLLLSIFCTHFCSSNEYLLVVNRQMFLHQLN